MVDDRSLTRRESLQQIGGFAGFVGSAAIPVGVDRYRNRSSAPDELLEIRLFTETAIRYQLQYPTIASNTDTAQDAATEFHNSLDQNEQHVYDATALPSRITTSGPLRMYVHGTVPQQLDKTDITFENDATYYIETAGATTPTAVAGAPSSEGHSPTRSYVHGQVQDHAHCYRCEGRLTAIWIRETASLARITIETGEPT
ncbi:hypothetical protein [Natronocalculus amylovorans]|uniref:Uncharacterized protein n=1 Tax=Natronocalculus amylovorans TaxID=2917812 RepID=A0AAE3FVS0_9EURY|nr:hypothetical protein [Natronocalculus amylovorans]MCL9815524.1 hypothetical protein [Natronocalculus amylovorans]